MSSALWSFDLAKIYFHNSEMQRRWSLAFLASKLRTLKGNERVLDLGCGDGKITADISRFVPEGAAVGVDPSEGMLRWAELQYTSSEYPNLSFQQGTFLDLNLTETFDVIVSHCALQHCFDQLQALKNCARLLNPGGKLWIMIPTNSNRAWEMAKAKVFSRPRWTLFLEKVPRRSFFTQAQGKAMLLEAGFTCQAIEKVDTKDPFIDREEFIRFLLASFLPSVSSEEIAEFYEELVDEYLLLAPEACNPQGVIEARFGRIELEAVKP